MTTDYKTPEKNLDDLYTLNSDTVKQLRNQIFSNTAPKSARSCLSEQRYTLCNRNLYDTIAPLPEDPEPEIKPSKLLTYEYSYQKKIFNNRKLSIEETEENIKPILKSNNLLTRDTSKTVSICTEEEENHKSSYHGKNISDADSVIYIGIDEKRISQDTIDSQVDKKSKRSSCENAKKSKRNSCENVKKSIIVLESTPCSVYCKFCKIDVHTSIELYHTRVPGGILRAFSSIFACCREPLWINNFKVHKCPRCSLVLAKCR